MDILRAFKLCGNEININIQGTIDEPLFQANQIGKILEMKKIFQIILIKELMRSKNKNSFMKLII
jgi:hypothetical protein